MSSATSGPSLLGSAQEFMLRLLFGSVLRSRTSRAPTIPQPDPGPQSSQPDSGPSDISIPDLDSGARSHTSKPHLEDAPPYTSVPHLDSKPRPHTSTPHLNSSPRFHVGSFDTRDIRSWTYPHPNNSKEVTFPKPFAAPPGMSVGLALFDMDRSANPRVTAFAPHINRESFEAHIDSWEDTKLYSGVFNFLALSQDLSEFQQGVFSTLDDHPWYRPQDETRRRITFSRPFVKPPKVISFLNELDMAKDRNWRCTTYVTDIDTKGFTLHINTWAGTVLFSATAGWIAYPEDREYVFSGRANTLELRPWDQPRNENHKAITFGGIEFPMPPKVFVGINSLDLGCGANCRLKASVDHITTKGLTWHIDGWADSVVHSAGISYLCLV